MVFEKHHFFCEQEQSVPDLEQWKYFAKFMPEVTKKVGIDGARYQYDIFDAFGKSKDLIFTMFPGLRDRLLEYVKCLFKAADKNTAHHPVYEGSIFHEFKLLISDKESVAQIPHMDGIISEESNDPEHKRFTILVPLEDTISPAICTKQYDELPTGEHFLDANREGVWDPKNYHSFKVKAGSVIAFDSSVPHYGPGFQQYQHLNPDQRIILFMSFGAGSPDTLHKDYDQQVHAFEWARRVYVDHLDQPHMLVSYLYRYSNANPLQFYPEPLKSKLIDIINKEQAKLLHHHQQVLSSNIEHDTTKRTLPSKKPTRQTTTKHRKSTEDTTKRKAEALSLSTPIPVTRTSTRASSRRESPKRARRS